MNTKSPSRRRRNGAKTMSTASRFKPAKSAVTKSFPVVGIGASAGGLEAFTQLLSHLPAQTGMAFVLVQHLAPKHKSALPDLLARATRIPIAEVKDGMQVEPDHVYVIPPDTNMTISDAKLHLVRRAASEQHMPIDFFFRSLAEDLKTKAIGVILSGTAYDGTIGMKAIKAEGGITFAQDEKSAKYPDMPRHAVAAGCVDFILPPEMIARELMSLGRHPYVIQSKALEIPDFLPEGDNELNRIFLLLRKSSGVDFTYYKQTTVRRRINRRMALNKIESLKDYLRYLQENPAELDALYQDILIHVTGFFRDPELFDFLKKKVFPSITHDHPPDLSIRIWVPGCSTGEEVYSIAISLLEFLGESSLHVPIQIFATDISEQAVEKARAGVYLENIRAEVSPERLRRFFIKVDRGYQIGKSIREMCVFARQDVTKDPPFSKLDLISCRNLLIYLGPILQKKVISVFHYALKPGGTLILGSSETIGGFSEHFTLIDKKHKIYAKKSVSSAPWPLEFGSEFPVGRGRGAARRDEESANGFDVLKEADRLLLSKYTPAGVIVNEDFEILQFRGHTGTFLEPAPGQASLSLLKMAREGLILELRAALHKAKSEGTPIRKEGIQFRHNGSLREAAIEVAPLHGPGSKRSYFLVLFYDTTRPAPSELAPDRGRKAAKDNAQAKLIRQLQQELAQTKAHLQSIIEKQETTNEELRSANEEILSSNEELQSTNEEMETAKEELQSTNEELTTLNEELQNRNLELSVANNDLVNLLSAVDIPIVMLDNDLRIRRFTPLVEKILNLIPTDVGRPITDIKINLNIPDLHRLILDAINSVTVKEQEVQDGQGRWHLMRIRPYKTADNRIDGAVMTWTNIDAFKSQVSRSRRYAEAIIETVPESILVLDAELRVKSANPAFYQTFQVSPEETENRFIYELGNGQWNIPRLRSLLEDILPKATEIEDFEVEHDFPNIGRRMMRLNARQIRQDHATELILLAIQDVTKRKIAEEAAKALENRYRLLFERNLAGICRVTLEGVILDCNPAMARMLGYDSPEEVMRLNAADFHFDAAERENMLSQLQSRGSLADYEVRFRRKDGRPMEVLLNTILVDLPGAEAAFLEHVVLDISERKQAERSLQEFSARLVQLQDEERQRIARELHDSTGSSLTGLLANLAVVHKAAGSLKPPARKALAESIEFAKQCSNEVRTLSYLLHPPLLDELGLRPAIRWLVEGFVKRSGIQVDLDAPNDLGRMPAEVETAIYRLVQESLTNIHLHSGSPTAAIKITRDKNHVEMEVQDQGKGMPQSSWNDRQTERPGAGVGITGMRERVRKLGGQLVVKSGPRGTTIKATLPLSGAKA